MLNNFVQLKKAANLAIDTDATKISKEEILKFGNTKAYKEQNKFKDRMRRISGLSKRKTIEHITALDKEQDQDETYLTVSATSCSSNTMNLTLLGDVLLHKKEQQTITIILEEHN